MLDSGNALFGVQMPARTPADIKALNPDAKIQMLLQSMAELGVAAMAAGERDLLLGPEYLKTRAAKAGLTVLSANLLKSGKPYFPASKVVTVGNARIGLIGLSPPNATREKGFSVAPPVKAALDAAAALKGKVDAVFVLAAVPVGDALALSEEKGIDFVFQSHEGRSNAQVMKTGRAVVVTPAERSRAVASLSIDVAGQGAFRDLGVTDQLVQQRKQLDDKISEVRARLAKATEPAVKQSLQESLDGFQARKRAIDEQISQVREGERTFRLSAISLGEEIASDPVFQKRVAPFTAPADKH